MTRCKWIIFYSAALFLALPASVSGNADPPVSATWFSGRAPILIDGDLSDWGSAGIAPLPLSQPVALLGAGGIPPATFHAAADQDYVYLAIRGSGSPHTRVLQSGLIAEVQLYGGISGAALKYKRYRGIDGLIRVSYTSTSGTSLAGRIRLGSDPPALVECPGVWDLAGVSGALKLLPSGVAAEISIPFEAIGWKRGEPPPGPLYLNVRVFGSDPNGAPAAVQWVYDPLDTVATSHEMLGQIRFDRVVPTAYALAQPRDYAVEAALPMIAGGDFSGASRLLGSSPDERALPLLALTIGRAGDPQAADPLLRRLTTDPSPVISRWAADRLAAPTPRSAMPVSALLNVFFPNPEAERLAAQGRQFADGRRWDDALNIFRAIAENTALSGPYRAWALLQIQKIHLAAGNMPESVQTGLQIQATAADGDPSRAESFTTLIAAYYGPGERLERARAALLNRTSPTTLASLFVTATAKRATGLGCRQTLELGELQRVEGSPERAAAQYRLASEMAACPRQDRAWSLLLLQRTQVLAGSLPSALGSALRLASAFSDEWDTRALSLENLERAAFTGPELAPYREAFASFRNELRAAASDDRSRDRAAAGRLLRRLDKLESASATPAGGGRTGRKENK